MFSRRQIPRYPFAPRVTVVDTRGLIPRPARIEPREQFCNSTTKGWLSAAIDRDEEMGGEGIPGEVLVAVIGGGLILTMFAFLANL